MMGVEDAKQNLGNRDQRTRLEYHTGEDLNCNCEVADRWTI